MDSSGVSLTMASGMVLSLLNRHDQQRLAVLITRGTCPKCVVKDWCGFIIVGCILQAYVMLLVSLPEIAYVHMQEPSVHHSIHLLHLCAEVGALVCRAEDRQLPS